MASWASGRSTPDELEEDPARVDDGHPVLGVALARAHAGLGRLLGHRLVREDADPHLAAALDVAGHRDSGGLDLAGGDPPGLERLDPEVAEVDGGAALGDAPEGGRAAACGDAPCGASARSVGLPAEVGRLVVLVAGLALDLLVLGQLALELVGLGRGTSRRSRAGGLGVSAVVVAPRSAPRRCRSVLGDRFGLLDDLSATWPR